MNHAIQPDYVNCHVTCSCGNSFDTRATVPTLKVEICGQCHPFYTGRQKFVDTAGRIQRFQEKYGWKGDKVKEATKKKKHPKPAATAPADQDDSF
ncbi:MAG: 50S ribosomal protein L31 [Planctomycetota bacterium]|nr:MAG: 50S ribosomal protein L31 [Planctomycetota bacterium]